MSQIDAEVSEYIRRKSDIHVIDSNVLRTNLPPLALGNKTV
jgi:hypothetical protein